MSTTQLFKNPRAEHNFKGRTCSIISVGSYVPERILTNAELEKMVDTTEPPRRENGRPAPRARRSSWIIS